MKKELKLPLPSAGDLFSTQETRDDLHREKVTDISFTEIDNFPDHPFQVKDDESMQAMVDSIKTYGVHTPAIVRLKDDDRFELVSGHRRKMASELAGLETLPCIIREMSRDEAIIAMVDANLQRDVVLPSEKAKSYKMRLEAMKRQAGRPNQNNYSPSGNNLSGTTSSAELADIIGESKNQIYRFVRLTELNPQILEMVDEGKIAMRPAVEMSYLSQEQQSILFEEMIAEDKTPSHVQAMKMRKFADGGRLDENVIHSIMQEEKPNQVEQFKMPKDKISKFFPKDTPMQKIEDTIIKALEMLRQRERSRADSR
jgi:ParB family chromosome partitioning protein